MGKAGVLLLDDDDDLREALGELVPLLTGRRLPGARATSPS